MQVGEPYNPHKLFYGAFVPNWLLARTEITQGAKLCFGRLMQFAEGKGICDPDVETLAQELGVNRRQVINYLNELREHRLVICERRGQGMTNLYTFVWHEWANDATLRGKADVQHIAPLEVRKSASPKVQRNARQEVQYAAPPHDLRERIREEDVEGASAPDSRSVLKREVDAILFDYYGATASDKDLETVLTNVERYAERGTVLSLDHLKTAVTRARQWCKEHQGKAPRSLQPLLKELPGVIESQRTQDDTGGATDPTPRMPDGQPVPKTIFGFGPYPGWKPGSPRCPQWWAKECEEKIIAAHGRLFEPSKVQPASVQ